MGCSKSQNDEYKTIFNKINQTGNTQAHKETAQRTKTMMTPNNCGNRRLKYTGSNQHN